METKGKRKRKRRRNRRLMSVLLSGTIAVTSCLVTVDLTSVAKSESIELQNPRVEMNTCDTVYFGSYWQEDTNGDGVADQNDEKTPIRWRILSKDGNDAYVMADQVLDGQPYHETLEEVTWETSTLRKWLNEEFYNMAFTSAEQEAVLEQTLVNEDNEEYGTEGGADTVDKVYLPSIADMKTEDYGFSRGSSYCDQPRIGKATIYAEEQGVHVTGEKGSWWWLRSPAHKSVNNTVRAACVDSGGDVNMIGGVVDSNVKGVRPALHLNLSSSLVQQGECIEISMKCVVWDLVELGSYDGKPITWRVLQRSGNALFLLSDQLLTDRVYHESDESITWKTSSLRSWLNGEFYQETFTGEEKTGICSHLYENPDNSWYGAEGGEDTTDNISLLSLEDIINPAYGFPYDYYCDHQARTAYGSEDDRDSRYGSWWWLRSPGFITYHAVSVNSGGRVHTEGQDAYDCIYGVRPVLYFDLSSYPLSKVGTITAEVDGNEYQWNSSAKPNVTNQPDTTQKPGFSSKPNTTNTPFATNPPENTETSSDTTPSVTPSGFVSTDETSSVSGSSQGSAKNQPTKLNIKNKKKYLLSKKLIIQDADGIRSVKLNGKTIKVKAGKKSITFKLSKYKKKLKKRGKWNRLVIIDRRGKKKTLRFRIK